MGEYDVKLEHDECITPVIVARGLALECLIGMPCAGAMAIKEAIRVLLKRPSENERYNNSCSNNP